MISFIIPLFLFIIIIFEKLKYSFHMLQQNEYNINNRYLKWLYHNSKKTFLAFDIVLVLYIPILIFVNNYLINYASVLVAMLICVYIYYARLVDSKKHIKKPLVITNRIKRLMVTTLIFLIIPFIFIFKDFSIYNIRYYYIILISLIYLEPFIPYLANIINIPVEKYVYLSFKRKALKKLDTMSNLKVVGITGSYGKTSSKNILDNILSIKYNVLASPKNWNTPYGLIRAIRNNLDRFDDIFIAEMGAYAKGDIKKLCQIVKPKYAILTKIGTAHLESMKTEENITKCKFELVEYLPVDGVAILNMDDEKQVNYVKTSDKIKAKIIWISLNNSKASYQATDIKMTKDGIKFACKINGKKVIFTTKLLGIPNIYNILASIALACEFGITKEELIEAIRTVKPVEHRLELKQTKDLTYIDDSYSSNPEGAEMAVDVLGLMPGKKIIMTPGIIELGDKQYYYNNEFGKQIAKVCDIVMLIGEKQTKPIYDGLIEKKFPKKNIYIFNDVKDGFTAINKLKDNKTYVLLENDLPDLFNE